VIIVVRKMIVIVLKLVIFMKKVIRKTIGVKNSNTFWKIAIKMKKFLTLGINANLL